MAAVITKLLFEAHYDLALNYFRDFAPLAQSIIVQAPHLTQYSFRSSGITRLHTESESLDVVYSPRHCVIAAEDKPDQPINKQHFIELCCIVCSNISTELKPKQVSRRGLRGWYFAATRDEKTAPVYFRKTVFHHEPLSGLGKAVANSFSSREKDDGYNISVSVVTQVSPSKKKDSLQHGVMFDIDFYSVAPSDLANPIDGQQKPWITSALKNHQDVLSRVETGK